MKTLGRRRWRWALRFALAATASAIGLVATGTVLSPASADSPLKVAWWSAAAASGQAVPAPDVNAGGMRVAVVPQKGVVAFGTISYAVPVDGSATLTLAVTHATPTPPTPAGSPVTLSPLGNLQACPTADDSWKAGDNQDIASAPKFDCNTFHFAGALSSDGTSMSFLLDGAADVTPGTMSLAIVPVQTTSIYAAGSDAGTDVTPPYFVDFDKPATTALQVDASSIVTPVDNPPPTSGSTTTGGTTATGSGTTPSYPTGSGVSLPATGGTTVPGQQAPVVATQSQAPTYAAAPVAATTPASNSDHRDLLLVTLMLLLFGILYTQNATRAPRVLAGPGAAAAPTDPTVVAAMAPYLPQRGLGRFTKPRTGSARPLI